MSTPPKPPPQMLIDARGRSLIEKRGVRRSSLGNDAYHFLRTATWTRILILFAALFLFTNLVFAVVLYLGHASVLNAKGFDDYYWFSVQTLATIGYGYLAPASDFANTVVAVESFVGLVLTALITGVFFARFSTPSARILYSKVAVISEHDGRRALQFRLANERETAIVEATVRAYFILDEKLKNGETMRRVYDLHLRRATSPVFALSFLVIHDLDEHSPMRHVTPESLIQSAANVIVTFTGTDDRLASAVHSRYVYGSTDIRFEHRFADLFRTDAVTGRRYIDMVPFHETHPLPGASA